MTATHADHSPLAQAARLRGEHAAASAALPLCPEDRKLFDAILADKYDYMDHPLFALPAEQAEVQIFDEPDPIVQPDTSWYHPAMTWMDEPRLGKSATKTMTAAEERVIFAQYNYCRFRVATIREDLVHEPNPDADRVRTMLDWHRKARAYREQIAGLNLALVLAMAKRVRGFDNDFTEMISEGNMALLRSVDKFDITRGFKFSTYACRAILKAFSRQGIKHTKYKTMFPTDFDPKYEKSNWQEEKNAEHENDLVDELKRILHNNKAELSPIERGVIEKRFAVGDEPKLDSKGQPKPLTLEQVGRSIGVTKERVRQIQNKALEKIRQQIESDLLR
ncbi:MAG: sigma-70 family RNA polymerase sigma factor [Planctomycetota bacterium]